MVDDGLVGDGALEPGGSAACLTTPSAVKRRAACRVLRGTTMRPGKNWDTVTMTKPTAYRKLE